VRGYFRWPSLESRVLSRRWVRLDDGLDPEELIIRVRVTIDEHNAVQVHGDFHLLGKPESCGATLKLVICKERNRRHPYEWREGCNEVRPQLEDLVIAGTNPGHTLNKERH